jgi:F-type H+-transporting ATPase subunit b
MRVGTLSARLGDFVARHRALGVALTSALVCALPALAAEEKGDSGNVFAGDIGNSLWTILIFVLLLVVLGKFAWGPILQGLQGREQFIREALEKAKHDRDSAEARLAEVEQRLAAVRGEATEIIEASRKDAANLAHTIQEEARKESERTMTRVRSEIELAKSAASRELYDLSSKLAIQLAGRILERELKPEDYERLLADSIREIGAQPPAS